ncbi:MAG: c-type cytochrome [Octadecabacter sp.]
MSKFIYAVAAAAFAAPALAEGDAAAGEQQFNRQCVACHIVADENGDVLAGRSARTGPNLYGIAGRQLGAIEGFRYGDAIIDLGETGATWNEAGFVAYVQDPVGWLRAELDDNRARGKMAYRVRNEQDALDIYAFLATLGPAE